MKKILLVAFTLCATFYTAYPQQKSNKQNNKEMKTLVAYFSATETTKTVAQKLAKATNADLYPIEPAKPYTSADLNWRNEKSRSSIEMRNAHSRPEMIKKNLEVEHYDVIFLGFPIWWGTAPRIINTFLEQYDFSEKTIILFATSGSSDLGNTANDLKSSCSQTTIIRNGKVLNGNPSEKELAEWVKAVIK